MHMLLSDSVASESALPLLFQTENTASPVAQAVEAFVLAVQRMRDREQDPAVPQQVQFGTCYASLVVIFSSGCVRLEFSCLSP
jgi:hypothetical protein